MQDIQVIKSGGQRENFSTDKLRRSIKRAGIPDELQDQVVDHIKSVLHPDIPTTEIYKHILEYLGSSSYPHSRIRYSLKKAIMELGPTGFPFEKFIAAILNRNGYKVETDVILRGLCVSHEIDVLAQKDNKQIMIECKFHNNMGVRTDVRVALYVMARFQDLTAGWVNKTNTSRFHEVWLVTNTKCSIDAIAYAQCMGMKIVSWGYPEEGNLQELVEKEKLHPVTCLSSLTAHQKKILLDNNIVLAKDILTNKLFLDLLNLSGDEKEKLLAELRAL
ncbi:hypothetical protein A3D05_03890 [Candidatus Gottesmanbacteria bacterium RIFCSPHIGHO2_02_FULL_40_24]|uniref:ATP-cone domain-containing protein n=1 Tax=Candidatus Gottesmanbacteria bacterium RIFCSPHIGHO2_01_FULL_40_15 TaxID=1798376 RepID=A0A1F5Z778_9BACT|nr:MAG: hypothetical protein A2777_06175 [Candidatus Gottesmanbacteria bacterium RIFCSPHIGHO2_01_FULL_40_15]OGG17845.1 MAG: hypothetical protein A3D05_03890 [Candidatus Gottesmanbacteria bacterium RIFCSPHIGHO2_02_FULL_40_24]OGG23080.1 MAG: hypothetical protein A3B48_03880 [Candidatus Gottesmanbacteria bacterium RIFCSPLOWO2_01_FULL_40_10]OGG24884.1 MAG: hypothetical protein A3E42_02160 [Candidatus Gottesmanbacteria bacterium RIFCSPHIGHO2_12_FULL_40_13]